MPITHGASHTGCLVSLLPEGFWNSRLLGTMVGMMTVARKGNVGYMALKIHNLRNSSPHVVLTLVSRWTGYLKRMEN